MQLKPKIAANVHLVAGAALVMTVGWFSYHAIKYLIASTDLAGTVFIGLGIVGVFGAAVINFCMAAAYRSRLVSVAGSLDCATLNGRSGVIAEGAKISFVRIPDSDNEDLTPSDRTVLFLSRGKAWSCSEAKFLVE
ncbi:hypothetical protein ACHAC9_19000 [Massilia sp. CMS3.1]|uniref:hypothetical protein n=1 Tax=Massilia sp. CMS3.1 TaxID=3373083 RepID=UPI003EE46A5A